MVVPGCEGTRFRPALARRMLGAGAIHVGRSDERDVDETQTPGVGGERCPGALLGRVEGQPGPPELGSGATVAVSCPESRDSETGGLVSGLSNSARLVLALGASDYPAIFRVPALAHAPRYSLR